MSVQIFLHGSFFGIEEFLVSPAHPSETEGAGACGERLLTGRSRWIALLSEALPRALLAELGLARILLGSSGGGEFLVVLPQESREAAGAFLRGAAEGIAGLGGGSLRLVWASTENLGDWSLVRKRLTEEFDRQRATPVATLSTGILEPRPMAAPPDSGGYFSRTMAVGVREAGCVGWSPESPARVVPGEGKHTWPLGDTQDSILTARHTALRKNGTEPAGLAELARRADGRSGWGVLRGDVDNFGLRLRRLQNVEEHVQLSTLYKQFFAGELQVVCSMPEFWRKVSILHTSGDDFAVYGAWDALILLAREIQRLFHQFAEANLKDLPGPEAKTISMALALAETSHSPIAAVYREAGRRLEAAKSADKDCVHLFGRTIEWRQLARAAELKDTLVRMVREFGCAPQFLAELARDYREKDTADDVEGRLRGPWRYQRLLRPVNGAARDREFQKLRAGLIAELVGKNAAQSKLRPAGRAAVEWARLCLER